MMRRRTFLFSAALTAALSCTQRPSGPPPDNPTDLAVATDSHPAADLLSPPVDGGADLATHPPPSGPCTNGWCWEQPLPHGNRQDGLFGLGPSDIWSVGAGGAITHFDGSSWSFVSGPAAYNLHNIHGTGPSDLWAVGDYGTVLHYDGTSFSQVPFDSAGRHLYAVYSAGKNDVWIGGMDGTLSHWDGSKWTAADAGNWHFMYLHGRSGTDIWGASFDGQAIHYDGTKWNPAGALMAMGLLELGPADVWAAGRGGQVVHNDGSGWTPTQLPGAAGMGDLQRVSGQTPGGLFVTGAAGTLASYNGASWSVLSTSTQRNLIGVYASSPRDVWAVGDRGVTLHYDGAAVTGGTLNEATLPALNDGWSDGKTSWAVGTAGTLLRRDGATWTTVKSGVTSNLTAMWGSAPDDLWAVGFSGTVLRYDGTSWRQVDPGTTSGFYDVWGSGKNDVWLASVAGKVVHYDGTTFTDNSPTGGALVGNLRGVFGTGPTDVWVVSDKGAPYHYDGTSWKLYGLAPYLSFSRVHGSGPADMWAVGGKTTIPNEPALWHWDGTAWTETDLSFRLPIGDLTVFTDVQAQSAADVWVSATGAGGGILHFDGANWQRIPCGSGDRLSGIWGRGSELFAGGELGTLLHRGP